MNRGILPILFFYLIERTVVQGFFPFLPIIANNITHNNRHASIYLTICYSALFLGSMLTDKVCNIGFSIKKLILINSIPLALLIGVIGLQKNIVFLTIVTAVAYFLIGLQINYVSIMVSSLSTTDKVGRNFGALNNVLLFGTVFGGFIVGPFIDGFGYNVAFEILGIALLLAYIPIIFVSLPEKKIINIEY